LAALGTATGSLDGTDLGTSEFADFWCKSSFSRSGLAALGTATGSLDGTDLGTAEFAEIFSGRSSFAESCH
jgi:hypothetical protein